MVNTEEERRLVVCESRNSGCLVLPLAGEVTRPSAGPRRTRRMAFWAVRAFKNDPALSGPRPGIQEAGLSVIRTWAWIPVLGVRPEVVWLQLWRV